MNNGLMGFPLGLRRSAITTSYVPVLFDPRIYGTTKLWLRADQVGTDVTDPGSSAAIVTTWQDLSGNNNHVTAATASSSPAYCPAMWRRLPGVAFLGTRLSNAVATGGTGGARTLIMVAGHVRAGQAGASALFIGGTAANTGISITSGSGNIWRAYYGTAATGVSSGVAASTSRPDIVILTYDGTTTAISVNGSTPATETTPTLTISTALIGVGGTSSSTLNTTIYEAAVLDVALSSSQVSAVAAQLQQQWRAT